jgi:membrane-bound lytic murein transglycosylase B
MRTTFQALACCLALLAVAATAAPARKGVQRVSLQSAPADYTQRAEVRAFIAELSTRHGFPTADLSDLFAQVRPAETALRIMATQTAPASGPPPRRNWSAYRARFIDPTRVAGGVRFWREHGTALARAERDFGVPAAIIVGILGVETIYGRNPGSFRVIDTLTSLAFDYPPTARTDRSAFFRGQLEDYLLFVRDQGLDPFALRGSYAGAIGIPQFMPGSYRRFAIDYDGDGRIDLRASPVDAIGSVANFLVKHGWRRGEPIVFPAALAQEPGELADGGLEPRYTLGELEARGITTSDARAVKTALGLVDLPNGEEPPSYVLGAPNFYVITQYNRSYFYAMSVVELGAEIQAALGAGALPGTLPAAAAHP